MAYDILTMVSEATGVLKSLIAIPSISRDEEKAADYLQDYIELQGMTTGRKGNNIWCLSPMFDLNKPTLLLNSHIDTVKAVNGWRKDPFTPTLESNGKLYGLGSNDAGEALSAYCKSFYSFAAPRRNTISFILLPVKKKCPERVVSNVYYRNFLRSTLPL